MLFKRARGMTIKSDFLSKHFVLEQFLVDRAKERGQVKLDAINIS